MAVLRAAVLRAFQWRRGQRATIAVDLTLRTRLGDTLMRGVAGTVLDDPRAGQVVWQPDDRRLVPWDGNENSWWQLNPSWLRAFREYEVRWI